MFIIWLILGVISLLYGGFILAANSGTKFYMIWFLIGGVFFVLSALTKKKIWRKLPKTLRIVGGVTIGLMVAVFLCVECLITSHFSDHGEDNLDYIIVLGAQMKETGPSRVLKYRLDTACAYLMQNEHTVCIVSGGQGPNEPVTEAAGMREYLLEKGIDESRILMEDRSKDTNENLKFSGLLLNPEEDHVGVVTNNFHVFRAVSIAKHQGFRHAFGIAAGANPYYQPNNMLREFLGVMKDFFVGNLNFS